MHSIRQKCRPKHQVLVLKCYPRTTKGAVDVKPNSSELSYLLFYATTRRSKVQKVGAFLEKKTASDVWHARIGNVQITLQILAALIEKSPRDLPLYAPYVLKILSLVQQSRDITMVESSTLMFDTFCQNHDGASVSAEQEYVHDYEEIIRGYASLASTRPPVSKTPVSAPVAMRWRNVGLQALRSVASSEALAGLVWRQLGTIVPVLLENIWTDDESYIELLQHKADLYEKTDLEKALRRRGSVATVRTVETSETNPAAVTGSAADADKLAEEDIGVLALHCLRQLFMANNRPQIRGATAALIKFIADRVAQGESVTKINKKTQEDHGWASLVIQMVCRWAPVQDRYVILVTAMENLLNSQTLEDDMPHQIVLATMIDSLLKSDINLIGLSVMDIQLGLIRHMLRLLHLDQSKRDSGGKVLKWENDSDSTFSSPSAARLELLSRLQRCIQDLATHIYYADQIFDMVSAILQRLRPTPNVAEVSDKEGSVRGSAPTIPTVSEDTSSEVFFSHPTAKVEALKAIKAILLVANNRSKLIGSTSVARNRVGVRTWEGTHWLIRETDGHVRLAYIEALIAWLDLEVTKADLQLFDEKLSAKAANRNGDLSRRAVSNASYKEKLSKTPKVRFIQLLHIAIYDDVLQYVDCEADLAALYLLLTRLNEKLGVNAVRNGLPMVVRLQEDIQDLETPISKVRLGSLCHGYFWALSRTFNFETSELGEEIKDEINRRRLKDLWADIIALPPKPIEKLGPLGATTQHNIPTSKAESESLRPFDGVVHVVDAIASSYEISMTSPPASPSASPSRSFVLPAGAQSVTQFPKQKIPENVKAEMLVDWNRDAILATAQEPSKSVSLNGSKSGTQVTGPRNFLTVTAPSPNGGHSSSGTPHHSRPPSAAYGLVGSIKNRKLNGQDLSPSQGSESSRNSVTRVDHLKRVLSGQAPPTRGLSIAHSDASSDSLVSYDFTVSEASFINQPVGSGTGDVSTRPSLDRSVNPLAANPTKSNEKQSFEIPPVPRIPLSLSLTPTPTPPPEAGAKLNNTTNARTGGAVSDQQQQPLADVNEQANGTKRRPKTRGTVAGTEAQSNGWGGENTTGADLESLLKGIDTSDSGKSLGTIAQPPY